MRNVVLLISGLAAGLGIGLAAPDLNAGLAVGARPAAPAGMVMQWVDRTQKGDRLDIPVTRIGKQPLPRQEMLDGCEPAASTLSPIAQAPARCAA
jgi:hypothetical protein